MQSVCVSICWGEMEADSVFQDAGVDLQSHSKNTKLGSDRVKTGKVKLLSSPQIFSQAFLPLGEAGVMLQGVLCSLC